MRPDNGRSCFSPLARTSNSKVHPGKTLLAPSAADRLLATRLGTATAKLIDDGVYGVMAAACGDTVQPVPLEKVVGKRRCVPLDHPWIESARRVGTALGD